MKFKSLRSMVSMILGVLVLMAPSLWAQGDNKPLPDLDNTGVVIPWSDFKTLLNDLQTQPTATPIPPPPVDYAFSQCRITARTNDSQEQLELVMNFSLQVLRDDRWVEVQVAPADLALESVEMDGAPAQLYRKNGYSCLAVRGRARHSLVLKGLVSVSQSQGRRWADLLYPPAPAALLDLTIPVAGLMITAEPGVSRGPEETAGQTRFQAALKGDGRTRISWFKLQSQDEKETTLFAETQTLLSVGEGSYHGTSHVAYTIHGQGIRSVDLELPVGLSILDLSGQGVQSWNLGAAHEGRVPLTVILDFQAQGAWHFDMEFEQMLGGSTAIFEVPDIVVEGVRRERGFLALEAATNVELTPGEHMENAALIDPSEIPQSLASRAGAEVLFVFKYLNHPVNAEISVTKHQDLVVKRSIAEQAHLLSFVSSQGRRLTSAVYTLRNNRKQFLAATLPAGATLWGAFREGQPVKASQREDGAILIPLKKSSLGQNAHLAPFDVELVWSEDGQRPGGLSRHRFDAPSVDLDVLVMDWEIYLPTEPNYFAFGGNLEPAETTAAHPDEGDDGLTQTESGQPGKRKAGELGRQDADKDLDEMRMSSQVAASNVARIWNAPIGQAGLRGMLPVRVEVPRKGRLLRFSRRLLSPGETSTIRFLSAPQNWRPPEFGLWVTFLLTFSTALSLGLCLMLKARFQWSVAAAILLIVTWLLSAGHRPAFLLALLPVACCLALARWLRTRDKETEEGF